MNNYCKIIALYSHLSVGDEDRDGGADEDGRKGALIYHAGRGMCGLADGVLCLSAQNENERLSLMNGAHEWRFTIAR